MAVLSIFCCHDGTSFEEQVQRRIKYGRRYWWRPVNDKFSFPSYDSLYLILGVAVIMTLSPINDSIVAFLSFLASLDPFNWLLPYLSTNSTSTHASSSYMMADEGYEERGCLHRCPLIVFLSWLHRQFSHTFSSLLGG